MSCESYKLLIGSYVDGELFGAARDEIESHLGACPQCVALAEEFRRLDEAAADEEEVPHVTGEEWTLVWDRVRRQDVVPAAAIRLPWRRQALRWSLAAAAALLIFALGAVVGWSWLPTEKSTDQVSERNTRSPATVESEADAAAERREDPPPAVNPETGTLPPSFSSF